MNQIEREKAASQARVEGVIAEWSDSRGFGWVEVKGKRSFAHIKEIEKGPRPLVGDGVTFLMGQDAQGRVCAKDLKFINKRVGLKSVGVGRLGWMLLLLVLPVCAGVKLPIPDYVVPGWMLVMSIAAWVCFGIDKKAAANQAWRIPENTLHLLEVAGGWPGAYLAQRVLRHKSRKVSYRMIFLGIVFLYQVVALDVLLEHRISIELMSILKAFIAE